LGFSFVLKTKEYKQFTEGSFVQTLYERYFQCLEETGVSWSILHKTTKEYRETSLAVFGAESLIVAEATLSLARVTQRSEEHASEAISWYEQASKYSYLNECHGNQATTVILVRSSAQDDVFFQH
jgi:hypothetical protein